MTIFYFLFSAENVGSFLFSLIFWPENEIAFSVLFIFRPKRKILLRSASSSQNHVINKNARNDNYMGKRLMKQDRPDMI